MKILEIYIYMNKNIFLGTLIGVLSMQAHSATFGVFDARSAAMGGTGVASSQIVSAPFYNPAMLSSQRAEEDFSLLAGVGVAAADDDNLLDHLSKFADAVSASDAATALSESTAAGNAAPASINVATVIAGGWSSEIWSAGFTNTNSVIADFGFTVAGVNGVDSQLNISGAQIAETNVALATTYGDIAIGITPKIVNIKSNVVDIKAADNSDISAIADGVTASTTNHGSDFDMDVGVVYNGLGNIKVGAVYKNLLGGKSHTNGSKTFKTQPNLRAGVAYTGDIFTLALDYDLTKNDPFVSGGKSTQFMAAGAEIDLLDFMQLRVGYNQNTADSSSKPTTTVGLGFNLLAFQIDLTTIQNNKSTSAFLQLGARW